MNNKWILSASSLRQSATRQWLTLIARAKRKLARVPLARKFHKLINLVNWKMRSIAHLVMCIFYTKNYEREFIAGSGLFDENWYYSKYAGFLSSGVDLLDHYLNVGVNRGFSPNPLFDVKWYKENYRDVARLKTNPLLHYIRYGAYEGRKPNPLFDSAWYLLAYPDVRDAGINPLAHFINYGLHEQRDPCSLFSTHWYISQYQDVARAGINPLIHYLDAGAYEGRDPNPYFSSAWYLSKNPDVARSSRNPLEHYLMVGWKEGRQPSPHFNGILYLSEYADVKHAGIDPLEHYLRRGRQEQRLQPIDLCHVNDVLPAEASPLKPKVLPTVDVIIPVYRGVAETKACIESVFSAPCITAIRVIVINDCSPEPEMFRYLDEAAAQFGFVYLINDENLGFVKSVNKGMKLSPKSDVLLLNSDTEVVGDWVDRIVAQAYAQARTGTVTPLSNNATICSYPRFAGERTISPGITLAQMDAACYAANAGRSIDVPTGVGFCMYIKRDCLNMIGLFDADAFGRGYGEENDFCLRAAAQGWHNILAMDTFVYHAGEVSFQSSSVAGKQKGMDALLSRHRDYLLLIASYVAEDPGKAYRAAITAQLWSRSAMPVILLVSHSLGGGTDRHVMELARIYASRFKVLILRSVGGALGGAVSLHAVDDYDSFHINIHIRDGEELAKLIKAFNVERVHIHHLHGFGNELEAAVHRLKLPFDFTLHDYYAVCPQINLAKDGARYCGEPDAIGCNDCIRVNPKFGAHDIQSWRMLNGWVFRDANRVITPSLDAAERIRKYAPDAVIIPIYHEEQDASWIRTVHPVPLGARETLRVAVIGVLAPHKGRQLIIEAATAAKMRDALVEFIVIGDSLGELPSPKLAAIRATGRYEEHQLQELIDHADPHIILYASQWPETYSYTLTAGLKSGRPILAPNIGAFPERLNDRPWCFQFDWGLHGADLLELLLDLRSKYLGPPCAPAQSTPASKSMFNALNPKEGYSEFDAYKAENPTLRRPPAQDSSPSVLVVLEQDGNIPTPCAYIRLVAFLDKLQQRGEAKIRYVQASDIDFLDGDVLITQRLPVPNEDSADSLLERAKRRGLPVIYDLDDNLYDLDPHAEDGKYGKKLDIVRKFVRRADQVWASTDMLAERLIREGAMRVQVQKNYLDSALWGVPKAVAIPLASEPIKLLYMGTRTHEDDFAIIEPALRKLKDIHGDKVEITLIGVCSKDKADSYLNFLTPPAMVGGSYPAFVSWIRSLPTFDIGLSPLRSTLFNTCKSDIKIQDYSALGLVPVISDIAPYRSVITHGVDGFLLPDLADTWLETLDRLVRHSEERIAVAQAAKRHYRQDGIERGADERLQALHLLTRGMKYQSRSHFGPYSDSVN